MFICAVEGCNNYKDMITIPKKDSELFNKWIKAIQRFDIPFGSDLYRICLDHFTPNLYYRTSNERYILANAVPNINLPPPVSEKIKQKMLQLRKVNARKLNLRLEKKKEDKNKSTIEINEVPVENNQNNDCFESNFDERSFQNDHCYTTRTGEDIVEENQDLEINITDLIEDIRKENEGLITIKIEDDECVSKDIKKEIKTEFDDLNAVVKIEQQDVEENSTFCNLNANETENIKKEDKETQTIVFPERSEPIELDSESIKLVETLNVEDLFTICRLCCKNRGYFDIFMDFGHSVNLAYIIFTLFKDWLPVTGPRLICKECKELLCQSYILHKNYRQSSAVVEKIINKNNDSKNNNFSKNNNDSNLSINQKETSCKSINSEPIEIIDIDEENSKSLDNNKQNTQPVKIIDVEEENSKSLNNNPVEIINIDVLDEETNLNNLSKNISQSVGKIKTKTPDQINSEIDLNLNNVNKEKQIVENSQQQNKSPVLLNTELSIVKENSPCIYTVKSKDLKCYRIVNTDNSKDKNESSKSESKDENNKLLLKDKESQGVQEKVLKKGEKGNKTIVKLLDINKNTPKKIKFVKIIKGIDVHNLLDNDCSLPENIKMIDFNNINKANNNKTENIKNPVQLKRVSTSKCEQIIIKKAKK